MKNLDDIKEETFYLESTGTDDRAKTPDMEMITDLVAHLTKYRTLEQGKKGEDDHIPGFSIPSNVPEDI